MRSFIVRIYRRSRSGGVSGTVQPIGGTAPPQAPAAFANAEELLHQMKAAAPAARVKARRRPA